MKSLILKADGLFLTIMGSLAAVMDILGYTTGKGPFGPTYYQQSITIGGFEAHCLAVVLGIILIMQRKTSAKPFYNIVAAVVHAILMTCNIIWYRVFIETDTVPMGYVATTIHHMFIVLNVVAVYRHKA